MNIIKSTYRMHQFLNSKKMELMTAAGSVGGPDRDDSRDAPIAPAACNATGRHKYTCGTAKHV